MKNLTASELLDFVDFVKNEKVYTARLQELEAAEKKARDAAGIAKTVEDAKALEEQAAEKVKRLDEKYAELEVEYKKKEEQLKKEYEDLKAELYVKLAKERTQFEGLRDMLAEQRKVDLELKERDSSLSKWSVELSTKEAILRKMDQKLRDKANRIKEISEE